MKTRKTIVHLAAILLAAFGASLAVAACSSDSGNSNPTPTQNDSGMAGDSTMPMGDDSSTGGDSSMTTDSTSPTDSSMAHDVVIDVGSCKSDAGGSFGPVCNSCYTPQQAGQDPLNACSPYTSKCVQFDPSRVPSHPTL